MTIKEQLADLEKHLGQTSPDAKRDMITVSKLMALQAELLDDNTTVPPDVFECLGADSRKIALMGFVLVAISALRKS